VKLDETNLNKTLTNGTALFRNESEMNEVKKNKKKYSILKLTEHYTITR
jgi:hypothetical protein